MTISAENRLPIRAALAVLVTECIAARFPTAHWYWAAIVAVVLVSGTWGEGTEKGITRFVMTAAGCIAAWAAYGLFGHTVAERLTALLIAVFFSVYFRGGWYGWFTFFISAYVVFLLAVLGRPTPETTWVRIVETGIGCLVAWAASIAVPMPRSHHEWDDAVAAFWATCRARVNLAFAQLTGEGGEQTNTMVTVPAAAVLLGSLDQLAGRYRAASFELAFRRSAHRQLKQTLEAATRAAEAVLALDVVANSPKAVELATHQRDALATLRQAWISRLPAPTTPAPAHRDTPPSDNVLIESVRRLMPPGESDCSKCSR